MDVFPSPGRIALILSFSLALSACGNRYDLATERGRQARMDDANFYLSNGQCTAAHEAIDPLYNSSQVDDEVRLVKASAFACQGTLNVLTLISNIGGGSNYFRLLARSLSNQAGDGARTAFYRATDVLTRNGTLSAASQRARNVNTYMVLLQMGAVGAILRNYGSPAADGTKGAAISYVANGTDGASELTTLDACALMTGFSILTDSFAYSSFSDADTAAVVNSLNSACVSAGLAGGCSAAVRDRTVCTGAGGDAPSVAAQAVVTEVNNAW